MTQLADLQMPVAAPLVLSDDQEAAAAKFLNFLLSPSQQVFVLQGYAGTGKSTLVKTLIERMPKYLKTAKLIDPNMFEYTIQLTATTNKAAETFASITGMEVRTIHSFLGLRVSRDYHTGQTKLIPKSSLPEEGYLLIIDEASYIDRQLLTLIFQQTRNCKVMFIGDPAQLSPVKSSTTPVFDAGFTTARLDKVMRQAEGNPIIQLATQFRETVETGVWSKFKPDGQHIIHLPRDDFEDAILAEFIRPGWRYQDSKILGWTNKCVVDYNQAINNHLTGDPDFAEGDYVVCNKHVSSGSTSLKTDQLVYITRIEPAVIQDDVLGNYITVDYSARFFCPKHLRDKADRIREAKAMGDLRLLKHIDEQWIDLRAAFAQTVNKSQGSTYDQVFIDLSDIGRCNQGDQIARMLYVAVSRARHKVYMTGDFG